MAQNVLFSKFIIISSIITLIIVPQIECDKSSKDVTSQSDKIQKLPSPTPTPTPTKVHDPIKCLLAHKEYQSIEFTYSSSCECGFQILQETKKKNAWFGLQGPRKLNHLKCDCPDLPKGCFHEKYQEIVIENMASKTTGTSITYKIMQFFHHFCIFIGYLVVFICITFGLVIVLHNMLH